MRSSTGWISLTGLRWIRLSSSPGTNTRKEIRRAGHREVDGCAASVFDPVVKYEGRTSHCPSIRENLPRCV